MHRGQGGAPYDGPWQLVMARSSDRGGSWEEAVIADDVIPTERFIVFTPPSPSVAVDASSGRVHVAFQDGRLGDADVYTWSLPSDGSEWEGPRRVNDTPQRGTSQYRPQLSVGAEGQVRRPLLRPPRG